MGNILNKSYTRLIIHREHFNKEIEQELDIPLQMSLIIKLFSPCEIKLLPNTSSTKIYMINYLRKKKYCLTTFSDEFDRVWH